MADEEVVLDVLISLKQEGLEMIRVMSGQLADLNDKVKDVNQSLERMSDRLHADALAFLELAGAATVAKGATGGGGVMGFVGALAALMPGGTVAGYAILTVLGLAAALAPLSFAFLAATTNAIAWTAIAGVAVSAIAGLAGAIFLLGAANAGGLNPALEMIKTQKALETAVKEHAAAVAELQQVQAGGGAAIYGSGLSQKQMLNIAQTYVGVTGSAVSDAQRNLAEPMSGLGGPIANLGTALDDLHDHFERISRPIADSIATWLTPFVAQLEKAGNSMVTWFKERLPAILPIMSSLLKDFGGFLGSVFTTVGKVVDYFIAHRAEVEAFWKSFLTVGAAAFDGLLNAMMNIATWFNQHWPAISKAAGEAWASLKKGWDVVGPLLTEGMRELGKLLADVVKHFGDLKPLLPIIGGVMGALALVVEGLAGGILILVRALEEAVVIAQWLIDHVPGGSGKMTGGGGGGKFGGGPAGQPGSLQPSGSATFPWALNRGGTSGPGTGSMTAFGGGTSILPVVFSPIPPNREQLSIIRDGLRRLNNEQGGRIVGIPV